MTESLLLGFGCLSLVMLGRIDIAGMFSTLLNQEDKFWVFPFAFLHSDPLQKGLTFTAKKISP